LVSRAIPVLASLRDTWVLQSSRDQRAIDGDVVAQLARDGALEQEVYDINAVRQLFATGPQKAAFGLLVMALLVGPMASSYREDALVEHELLCV
jgi:hypothetical protein